MRFAHMLALAGAVMATFCTSAFAIQTTYTAVLSGPAESPPNASPATGVASITIDSGSPLLTMHVVASFSGLSSGTTASHIHCCTADPHTGTAAVATTTPTFIDFPLGVTAATYDDTFNLVDASSWNPAFVTANGGLSGAFAALVAGLDSGEAYFNIHTVNFPTGEVRGFLTSVSAVPEPETYVLLLAGLGLLRATKRRHQRV